MLFIRRAVAALVLSLMVAGATAQSAAPRCALVPYQPCGAGEMLCRCESNLFTDLTNVTAPPGTREYVNGRLLEMGNRLVHQWQPGDILFVGDSLTDIGRMDFDPLLPRTANLGILGAKISDVVYTLDLFEMFFASPSKVVVLVGSNNLRPNAVDVPAFVPSDFDALAFRLKQFKDRHLCEIIVRSIPPGEPDVSPQFSADEYYALYNQAVRQANAYLAATAAKPEFGFTFVDDHGLFWNDAEGRIDYHMFTGARYTPCAPVDNLHLGCLGYMASLSNLAGWLYPQLPGQAGSISALTDGPAASPLSGRPLRVAANTYRYASVTVPPAHFFVLNVSGSPYNYAGFVDPLVNLFTPGFPYGFPSMESETFGAAAATVAFHNHAAIPQTLVLCLGSAEAQPGHWNTMMLPVAN